MKIALVENFGGDFYKARVRYAKFLTSKGHDVYAILPNDGYIKKVQDEGVKVIPLNLPDVRERSLSNIFAYLKKLRAIFKKETFDVVHLYRMQPNLIGSFSAYTVNKKTKIINHVTGLGIAFTKKDIKHKVMQNIIKLGYRLNASLFKVNLVFQNHEDMVEIGDKKRSYVVTGSAVNEDLFNTKIIHKLNLNEIISEENQEGESIKLIFVSRLLRHKGLTYLVEAISEFNNKHTSAPVHLIVAGWIDPQNPGSYTKEEIEKLKTIPNIHFLGKRDDVNKLISVSDVAILPTYYREGTPRFLLEAMAMGKPIITTDMPGCNHLIKNSLNGILVKPKNKRDLIVALERLTNLDLEKMGEQSKQVYKEYFSEDVIYNQLLSNYNK